MRAVFAVYFIFGISPAVVASLPARTRSRSSLTHGIVSAFRSIHRGRGVRRSLFVQLREFNHHVVPTVTAQIVQLSHVDAIGRARLGAQRAEQAFAVIDRESQELAVFRVGHVNRAGILVDPAGSCFIDVDAVDGASFSAQIAGDAFLGFEFVDAAIAWGEAEALLGVLDGDGFLEAIFQRDLHARDDRRHGVADVGEIFDDAAHECSRIFTHLCPLDR